MGPEPGAAGRARGFQAFDVFVVVICAVAASLVLGAAWSYLRVGGLSGPFVREAQFLLAMAAFVLWTIRNRSGGRIDEVDDDGTVPVPPPSERVKAYRRLTGHDDVTVDDALVADAYLFAVAVALFGLSVGMELFVSY